MVVINVRQNVWPFSNLSSLSVVALRKYNLASIIHAPRSGATVCCTHLRLDAEWGSHCDGKMLGAYISS